MFPILNPNSLARGGRTNLDEIDLDRRLSDSGLQSTPVQRTACNCGSCMKESDPGRAHIRRVGKIRTQRIKGDLAREPESP